MRPKDNELVQQTIHAVRGQLTLAKFDESLSKNDLVDSVSHLLSRLEVYIDSSSSSGVNELIDLEKVVHDVQLACDSSRVSVVYGRMEVLGNSEKLTAMLLELLGNALTYTEGNVTMKMQTENQKAMIAIEDSGDGIPASVVNRAEVPFEGRGSQGDAGPGLGLAIAFAVAESHGGKLTVSEAKNGGAVVEVSLDLV